MRLTTIDDVQRVLLRVSFDAPMRMVFTPRLLEAGDYRREARVRISLLTRQRGTPSTSGYADATMTMLDFDIRLYEFIRNLRDRARQQWLHEFDEWFSVDGKLTNDPHLDEDSR